MPSGIQSPPDIANKNDFLEVVKVGSEPPRETAKLGHPATGPPGNKDSFMRLVYCRA